MYGLIQKIELNNYIEYFFNLNVLFETMSFQGGNDDLINELSDFVQKRAAVFDLLNKEFGLEERVSARSFVADENKNIVYYHFRLTQEQISFMQSSTEFTTLQTSRDTVFPKLGWTNFGYRVINDTPNYDITLNPSSTINFSTLSINQAENIWDLSSPLN